MNYATEDEQGAGFDIPRAWTCHKLMVMKYMKEMKRVEFEPSIGALGRMNVIELIPHLHTVALISGAIWEELWRCW